MIKHLNSSPAFTLNSVEHFKIKTNYSLYTDMSLFWTSDEGGIISSLDWDAVISGKFNYEELNGFLKMSSPLSIFCSMSLAEKIVLPYRKERAFVFVRDGEVEGDYPEGDTLKSDEIYKILKVEEFNMPPADSFSPDFCLRLNHGALCYYAEKEKCAAVAQLCDDVALITGVTSREKGLGSKALMAVIKKANKKKIFAVAKPELEPFYIKNGFKKMYEAAYLLK